MNTANRSRIVVIGACTSDGAYGLDDDMPWQRGKAGLPGDMLRFKSVTEEVKPGKVNLLVAGRVTAETMKDLDLGPNRLLVSVSRHHPEAFLAQSESLSRHDRITFARSFADTLNLLPSPIVDKLIFIGGSECWKFGMTVAGKAYITLAYKECPGDEYARLNKPLTEEAEAQGFVLIKKTPNENPAAWSPIYNFLDYVRE